MDELEISGKRYISTRRAAKDHKYHADYIGQLIRAGKVEGQKVGRSWYVVEDSLSSYLSKEGGTPVKTIAPARAPTRMTPRKVKIAPEVEAPEEAPEEVQEEPEPLYDPRPITKSKHIAAVKIIEEPSEIEQETVSDFFQEPRREAAEYHIPVKIAERGGLRYMADDEPLFPAIKKSKETHFSHVAVMPTRIEVIPKVEIEIRPRRIRSQSTMAKFVRAFAIVAISSIVFAMTALVSVHLLSTTSVAGEAASSGFSLQ